MEPETVSSTIETKAADSKSNHHICLATEHGAIPLDNGITAFDDQTSFSAKSSSTRNTLSSGNSSSLVTTSLSLNPTNMFSKTNDVLTIALSSIRMESGNLNKLADDDPSLSSTSSEIIDSDYPATLTSPAMVERLCECFIEHSSDSTISSHSNEVNTDIKPTSGTTPSGNNPIDNITPITNSSSRTKSNNTKPDSNHINFIARDDPSLLSTTPYDNETTSMESSVLNRLPSNNNSSTSMRLKSHLDNIFTMSLHRNTTDIIPFDNKITAVDDQNNFSTKFTMETESSSTETLKITDDDISNNLSLLQHIHLSSRSTKTTPNVVPSALIALSSMDSLQRCPIVAPGIISTKNSSVSLASAPNLAINTKITGVEESTQCIINRRKHHFQIIYYPIQARIVDFHTHPLQGHTFHNIKNGILGIDHKDVETHNRNFIETLMVLDLYDDSTPL